MLARCKITKKMTGGWREGKGREEKGRNDEREVNLRDEVFIDVHPSHVNFIQINSVLLFQ